MKHTFAGAAAAGLAAIALIGAPVAAAGPEEDFLIAVAAAGIASGDTQQVVALGRSVCTDQATGTASTRSLRISRRRGAGPPPRRARS